MKGKTRVEILATRINKILTGSDMNDAIIALDAVYNTLLKQLPLEVQKEHNEQQIQRLESRKYEINRLLIRDMTCKISSKD